MQKNWTQTTRPTFDRDNALKMNEIAKTVFAPIYPVIARNALAVTGVTRGVCLDLGSGPGMLAMSMAREAPGMDVIAFDFSADSGQIAMENIREAKLADRIRTEAGDVHAMPFDDGHVNLIVSRGSMFFWKDLKSAFREIYRVLAPGGATYIGGGFGSLELREQVVAAMLKRNPDWDCYAKKKTDGDGAKRFGTMFGELGWGDSYRVIDDETGFWVVLFKPA
jgi:ubiquinone/menaquinone biosynthesis C-methylase UbiE